MFPIGPRITSLRTQKGWTQVELAFRSGIPQANLSKIELCKVIQKHLPQFTYTEAPIGEDPDKRDYIVSNARLAGTGFRTEWDLDRGIRELIKGYTILRNTKFGNI